MIKYLKINWIIFKNAFIRDSKIPGVVFSSISFHIVEIAVTIIFFRVIFANTSELAGWNFYQVLFLYAFAKVIISINNGWFRSGLKKFSNELIRMGDYDFYLIKPVDPMILVSISQPRLYNFIAVLFEIGICFYAVSAGQMQIGIINFFWFLYLAFFGLVLYYFLSVLTIVPTFWFVRLWSLQDLMGRLSQVMRYPSGVFPPFIRAILMTVFPIVAVAYLPVYTLFNPPKIEYIIYIALATIIFGVVTNFLWHLGNKHYSSASS
jgi:ABC-2 type transport system permease protein